MINNQRKVIFLMPNIQVKEKTTLQNIRLIPYNKKHKNLVPSIFNKGTLIEIDDFKIGDLYDLSTAYKIHDAIEIIKFSYFGTNAPIAHEHPGFISDSTFDIFTIIEENVDKSFEHKVRITNGVDTYLLNLNEWYKYKSILGNITPLKITINSFASYFQYIYDDCIINDEKLSIIKLYNKCLKITDMIEHFDKILFARTSIETLNNLIYRQDNKNYIDKFFNRTKEIMDNYKDKEHIIIKFYNDNIISDQEEYKKLQNNLDTYLNSLRNARHDLVHENKINTSFQILEVYIVWFPLFFLINFFKDTLEEKHIIRLVLFLGLLKINPKFWNNIDKRNYNKKTSISIYSSISKSLPIYLDKNEIEYAEACLTGFNNNIEKFKIKEEGI